MRREQAIKEICEAGAEPVEQGPFLRFKIGNHLRSFFPNHYENMRRGEVVSHIRNLASTRRRPS